MHDSMRQGFTRQGFTRQVSRRDLVRLAGALAAGSGLSACGWGREDSNAGGRPGSPATTLKVWDQFTTTAQSRAVEKIYHLFTSKHGDLRIARTTHNGDQMTTIGKTALSSGTGPDVIYYQVGAGNAGLLADAGLIRPLDDLAEKFGWTKEIAPFAQREARLNGTLYGLPHESEVAALFYNKTLIDKAGLTVPETFDELLAFAATARRKGHVPIAYGQLDIYPCWWAFSLAANNLLGAESLGALVFDNDGSWDTPEITEAIRMFFVDLVKAGAFIDELNAVNASDAHAMFLAGKALMSLNGTWAVGGIEEALPGQEIGIIALPSIGDRPRVYPAGSGSAYYLSSKSRHADQAAAFLDFLYTPEAVRIWVEEGRVVPPVEFDPSGWKLSGLQRAALTAAQNGGGDPSINLGYFVNHGQAGPSFLKAMTAGFQAIVAGTKKPAQVAGDLQRAWEAK
ncbi:ABC transporter substrate-binding protein [Actinopolymorpha alba]|uniref:ABC transporter substrate-binding protein n=1 Tax=Actinopolymorpha alba TaxID=533267 RepID=UPI0003766963|nr:extracellular solute-binding protein [Actinopolymorpha alba]